MTTKKGNCHHRRCRKTDVRSWEETCAWETQLCLFAVELHWQQALGFVAELFCYHLNALLAYLGFIIKLKRRKQQHPQFAKLYASFGQGYRAVVERRTKKGDFCQ